MASQGCIIVKFSIVAYRDIGYPGAYLFPHAAVKGGRGIREKIRR